LTSVYTVIVVDGCGATTTASTTVYTDPTPQVNLSANFYEGCAPFCIQFHNQTMLSSGGIGQSIWTFGDGDSSHTKNPIYCYPTSGSYDISLTVVSDSGCTATLKRVDLITIFSAPKAAFTYSPQPVTILTPTVQFIDESTDAYGIAYHWWAYGDNSDSTSNLADPVHTYQDTGSYCANLIVMNNRGCTDTTTNCFIIEPDYALYIPSAFTPNGDRKNEVFKPVGKYIKNYEMYIFDRWGMEIFHSTDMNNGWNGTLNGTGPISQEDIYVYKITITDSRGTEHSYVGRVTLLN
jgi:gliding motility-associated-like protein